MKLDRTSVNVVAGLAAIASAVVINLFVAPVLVSRLGPQAFGFVGLINTIVAATTIVSTSLHLMVGRYVSLEIHRGNDAKANEYFSSALVANSLLSLLVIMVMAPVIVYSDLLFGVSGDLLKDLRVALIVVVVSFVLTAVSNTLSIGCIARNRLDLSSLRDIGGNFLRMGVILALFLTQAAAVRFIGYGFLAAALVAVAVNVWLFRVLLREVRLDLRKATPTSILVLLGAGSTFMVNAAGGFLLSDATLIVANTGLGADAMGLLALARVVPLNLLLVAGAVAASFSPLFIRSFSGTDVSEPHAVLYRSMSAVFAVVAVPFAGFLLVGQDFIRLWLPTLNDRDMHVVHVAGVVLCVGLVADALTVPFFPLLVAGGRIRAVAYWSLALGVGNLALLGLIALLGNLTLIAIVVVGACLAGLKSVIVVPICAAGLLEVGVGTVAVSVLQRLVRFVAVLAVMWVPTRLVDGSSWGGLIGVTALLSSVGYAVVLWRPATRLLARR